MTLSKYLYLSIVFISFLLFNSCGKNESNKKCDDCVVTIYECDKEGGEVRWKVNGKNEVSSGGYFFANQGETLSPPETQHILKFAGNLEHCFPDINGSTNRSALKFGKGEFSFYIISVNFKDFCGEDSGIGGSLKGKLIITSYDGFNAGGTFNMEQTTGGATQCKPDLWTVVGTFKNVPVY